jgi:hypothetical protein
MSILIAKGTPEPRQYILGRFARYKTRRIDEELSIAERKDRIQNPVFTEGAIKIPIHLAADRDSFQQQLS